MPEEPLKSLPGNVKVLGVQSDNNPIQELPSNVKVLGVKNNVVPAIKDFNPEPTPTGNIEGTLADIEKTAKGTILNHEKDVLRDLLTNPNTTPEQARETISTIQGYHPKFTDKTSYYLKRDDNGVLVAKPLASGEKPPKGYNVASVWGNQKEAKDDAFYTDLGKSLYNGLVGIPEGVNDLAQLATIGITGKESKTLNNVSNALESLKFEKDPDLNKPVFNAEGITKWADVLDKNRFDLSPEALWGTMNMAAESVISFLGGAAAAGKVAQGVQGVKKLADISKGAQRVSAFTGSFLTYLGDNIDNAKEAGLEGRDIAAVASIQTSLQASIDAALGIESKVFNTYFRKTENQLMKELGKSILRDASGKITQEGFRQLARNTGIEYSKLASTIAKETVKDAGVEALQEAGQDFVGKAAEQVWDKLSDEDKAKFGTDIKSPQAFGSYIQNGLAGLIGGAPMAGFKAVSAKEQYDKQSLNAFDVVNGGVDKINETKANLYQAAREGEISEKERDNAVFKIDSYKKYADQLSDFPNMNSKDKKEAFELSFNIEALKNETKFTPEELSSLDPIALAKIDTKKELIKGLQKDLNRLLLNQDIQRETKVGQDTVNKVAKDVGVEMPEGQKDVPIETLKQKLGKITSTPAEEVTFEEPKKPEYKQFAYDREKTPHFDAKDKNGVYEFNKLTDPVSKQRAVRNYLDEHPELGNEMEGTIEGGQNNVWHINVGKKRGRDDRYLQFARSIDPDKYTADVTNFPSNEKRRNIGDKEGRPYWVYDEPVVMKLEEIETDDKNYIEKYGKRKRFLNVYNKQSGKYITSIKEKQKGNTKATPFEESQYKAIQQRGYTPDVKGEPIIKQEKYVTPTPVDEQLEQIDYEQTRPLEETEVQEELAKEQAREQAFAETGSLRYKIPDGTPDQYFNKNITNQNKKFFDDFDSVIRGKNKDVLLKIKPLIQDKTSRMVLNKMIEHADKLDKSGIVFNGVVYTTEIGKTKENDKAAAAWFDSKEKSIVLNSYFSNEYSKYKYAEWLLHEYLHAFTVNAMDNPKTKEEFEFRDKIDKLYNDLKSNTDYISEYGLTNSKELISELGSNPDFVQKMKSEPTKNKSWFSRIVDAIIDFLFGKKSESKIHNQWVEEGINNILSFIPESNPNYDYASNYKSYKLVDENSHYANMGLDNLLQEYNDLLLSDEKGKSVKQNKLMEKIALTIKEKQIRESGKQLDDEQTTRDINGLNKWFKVLSHFSDAFPEMKGLSKIWNSAFFAKMKEAKEQKRTHNKLAAEVVKDRNKKLGIKQYAGQKLAQLISEQGDKYFGYLDDGKGKLITLDQARQKNLSDSQINYLKYVREQLKDRALEGEDIYNSDMDVLRTDQSFNEAYRASGLISAIGSLIGSNSLSNVKLNFVDPKTGKEEKMDYIDIVNNLSKYSEGGIKEKLDATWQLLKYTRRAIKGRKAKGGEYFLDENGKLNNRFNSPVDNRKAYSKNFYNAMNQYIDETAHIKHISPLVPIVDSLQYMNEHGIMDSDGEKLHSQKKELSRWIDTWKKLHIFKQEQDVLNSDLTAILKILRFMTSAITMWFNVPANAINIAIGNYNNWRQENFKTWAKGQSRLFGGKKRRGYGVVNKYALDLIDKYSAISVDTDSSPLRTTGNWFIKLAYLGQSLGETQIQGSGLLGLMSDEDYNSFEYNDEGDLVVKKGVDEKALEERILAHIDRVSDVQGKYGEKDRRNIMNNELGRALMAYKVWIPDALRTRFGEEGTVTKMFKDGFKELRNDIKEKGKVKAFWENKAFMSNLKGLMTIGLLMSVTYMDDEDDEKSEVSKLFQRALSDVLFVFDPDNLKFTIKRPIAAVGAVEKLIDLGDHLFAFGEDDFFTKFNKYGDKGDSKIGKDIVGLLPRPAKFVIDEMLEEE